MALLHWLTAVTRWFHASLDESASLADDVFGVFHLGCVVRHPGDLARATTAFFGSADCRRRRDDRLGRRDLTVPGRTDGGRAVRQSAAASRAARHRRSSPLVCVHPNSFRSDVCGLTRLFALLYAHDGADQCARLSPDERCEAGFWIDSRAWNRWLDRCRPVYRFSSRRTDRRPHSYRRCGLFVDGRLQPDTAPHTASALCPRIQTEQYLSSGGLHAF